MNKGLKRFLVVIGLVFAGILLSYIIFIAKAVGGA